MDSPKKRQSTVVLLLGVALTAAGWLSARSVEEFRQEPETKIRVETRLVLVDVVVTDKKGNPARGLAKEDFALKENGKKQAITEFSWEGREKAGERPAPPPLAENVRTNQPEYHPLPGPLTIILLDSLNTPARAQKLMRTEVLSFLTQHLRDGQRTAILNLTGQVRVLQDFTSSPELLAQAVRNFRAGTRPMDLRSDSQDEVGPLYRVDTIALAERSRAQLTIDALGGIARAMRGYPGRKNLIWVSAAFPSYFAGGEESRNWWNLGGEIREVSRLLTDARLVIYPVDPRGLVPLHEPARFDNSGRVIIKSQPASSRYDTPHYELATSQMAMRGIAAATGGKIYTDRNDLANAVAEAAEDGSAYYVLGYYPANKKMDGKFRRIEVKLAKKGYKLRYRRGYYATEQEKQAQVAESDTEAPAEGVSAPDERNLLQLRAALFHPLPPTGLTLYTQVSPPKQPSPASVMVQILVDAKTVTFRDAPGQSHRVDLDFVLAAFTPQGVQLKNSAERFRKTLNSAQYQKVMEGGMLYPMNLRLDPDRYVLRMLVRDNFSGKLGRVDTPLEVAAPEAN